MRGIGVRAVMTAGVALLVCLVMPATAYADMGPPIFLVGAGVSAILLVEAAVVVIEAPVLHRFLGVGWARSFLASVAANAVSALAGIPLAGGVGAAIAPVTRSLGPSHVVRIAAIALAGVAISFICSSLIEWPVVKLISRRDWTSSAVAVVVANAVSHAALLVLAVAAGIWLVGV